ncbi:hypothetical protein Nepgr_013038 [Nepenthes gracilis]|uniref:FAS1 domain-containing protein n=1 Tax=Nepenthes gracilis TaxID=150966 RepID=A0AAD3SHD7_NEPGR|nr:hypothetical protein Nepgr_013038 [Nepenthes gracilis]
MAARSSSFVNAHFTSTRSSYFVFIFSFSFFSFSTPILGLNITAILSSYPDLSDFTSLLSTTAVSYDLGERSSLTILAVPNSYLRSSSNPIISSSSPTTVADIVRYHVVLQYLTWSDLRQIPPAGTLFTTLFQTTGRATKDFGSLNFTFNPSNGVVSLHSPTTNTSKASAVVLSLVKTIPYNISIFSISSLLAPYDLDLMESETQPPPLGINITKALIDGRSFNVAASMLTASGVVEEFEADEGGAGITLFVPTDEAFANLPSTIQLQALPAEKKALVMKFHVLHSYYPLGSLELIVNPVEPTLATENNGAGSFTLNISRVNGSLAINSGIVQAVVTQTVFDQNPVAIFGISNVLLPREIFGSGKAENVNVSVRNGSRGGGVPLMVAQPPSVGAAPDSSLDRFTPPSHLSSPPGFRDEISSGAAGRTQRSNVINSGLVCCIGSLYLLV